MEHFGAEKVSPRDVRIPKPCCSRHVTAQSTMQSPDAKDVWERERFSPASAASTNLFTPSPASSKAASADLGFTPSPVSRKGDAARVVRGGIPASRVHRRRWPALPGDEGRVATGATAHHFDNSCRAVPLIALV